MKHLEDEDIAGMIDGTISKKEREHFLKHLSECNTCFEVYTDTLKFIEKEKKPKVHLKLPDFAAATERFKQAVGGIFTIKKLVPVTAALIIILLIGLFGLKEIKQREIKNKQIAYIKNTVETEMYTFSPSRDEIYAAVRSGIFVEDLSLLVNTGQEELKRKIVKMLNSELKTIVKNETGLLYRDLDNIDMKHFDTVVQLIRALMEKQSLSKLFQFGRFIEQCILKTLEGKRPGKDEVERYLRIAEKYNLPEGVNKNLQKVKLSKNIKDLRDNLEEVTAVFLASQ